MADPVNALAMVILAGAQCQAQLLLEGSGKGATHRVRLPARGLNDLADGGAFWALEHSDDLRLLGVLPDARRGFDRLGRSRWHRQAQRLVSEVGDPVALTIDLNQPLTQQAAQHLVTGAALEVVGKPAQLATGRLDGGVEDLGLGVGQLHGHLLVIDRCALNWGALTRRTRLP